MLLFVVGTGLTGATLVFDEGTIGLLRGGVQLWRNMAMSAIKLAVLPVTAFVLHDTVRRGHQPGLRDRDRRLHDPRQHHARPRRFPALHRPDWQSLRRLLPVAINHNWLNLAMATPSRIIPIVVTVVVGGDKGAVFYVAWMITSLLVHGARPPGDRAVRARVGVPPARRGEAPLRAAGVAADRPAR